MLAGVYGSYRIGTGYVAGRATWTHAELRINRNALIGGALEAIGSARTDGVGRATIEAGKSFGSVTPYGAVTALRVDQAAFTEQGAAGFGLTAESHRRTATLGDLGLRWNTPFSWIGGDSTVTGYAA